MARLRQLRSSRGVEKGGSRKTISKQPVAHCATIEGRRPARCRFRARPSVRVRGTQMRHERGVDLHHGNACRPARRGFEAQASAAGKEVQTNGTLYPGTEPVEQGLLDPVRRRAGSTATGKSQAPPPPLSGDDPRSARQPAAPRIRDRSSGGFPPQRFAPACPVAMVALPRVTDDGSACRWRARMPRSPGRLAPPPHSPAHQCFFPAREKIRLRMTKKSRAASSAV